MSKMKFISAYRTFTRLQSLLVVLWLPFISTTCDHVCKSPILVFPFSTPSVLVVEESDEAPDTLQPMEEEESNVSS